MECDTIALVQVFSTDLPSTNSWFCLNPVLNGRGEKEKITRGKILQKALPEDVKIIDFKSVRTASGQELPPDASCSKREKTSQVCVGTQFALLASVIKSQKHLDLVNGTGCLSFLRESVNKLVFHRGAQESGGVGETPKGRVPRSLFTTSTPTDDSFSTPVKRKFASDESGIYSPSKMTIADIKNSIFESPVKRQKIGDKASEIYEGIQHLCTRYRESLKDVLGYLCLLDSVEGKSDAKTMLEGVLEMVAGNKGVEGTIGLFPPGTISDHIKSLRPPDWIVLLFKLSAKLPDDGWQMLVNLLNLGRTGVSKIIENVFYTRPRAYISQTALRALYLFSLFTNGSTSVELLQMV